MPTAFANGAGEHRNTEILFLAFYPKQCYNGAITPKEHKSAMITKVLLIILIILAAILALLIYFGKKMQKKQAESQAQMEAMAQTVSMLIIDKKKLRIKDSGLPAAVIEQTPRYLRLSKLPVVKAKIGPKVMNLIADEKVFELLPVKKEAKVVVSGIYITAIKGARGGIVKPQPKKGFFKKLFKK